MLNEILGPAARFQQLLTRKFGILGGAPSPQLTPEVTPEYSLPTGPENLILATELLAAGTLEESGGAGASTQIALWNPTGSNIVLVLERIEFINLSAGASLFGGITKSLTQPFPDLPAAGAKVKRETRVATDASGVNTTLPVGILCASNAAGGVVTPSLFNHVAAQNATIVYDRPVIIAPSWHVAIRSGSNNISVRSSWSWREVPIAQGEQGPF